MKTEGTFCYARMSATATPDYITENVNVIRYNAVYTCLR